MPVEVEAPAYQEGPFGALERVLGKWFYKPDLQAIRIVMSTLKAHYLNVGDPAWLFVVAPPGSGKTSVSIMGASGLPDVQILSDLTENTFLSGFYGHREPGLLEKLGETASDGNTHTTKGDGVFLVKDFTTVLTMRTGSPCRLRPATRDPRRPVQARFWHRRNQNLAWADWYCCSRYARSRYVLLHLQCARRTVPPGALAPA